MTNRLLQSIKSLGIYATCRKIFYGYLTINKFIVFHKDLREPFTYTRQERSVQMMKIPLDRLQSLRNQNVNLSPEFYCDQIYNLSTPYVAFVDDRLAAIYWAVYPGESSRFLQLKEGEVELNYSFVLPQFRGQRLGELLMAFIIKSCKQENQARMLGVVSVNNIPQFKPMLRIGFEPVEVLTHFGFYRPKATLRYIKR